MQDEPQNPGDGPRKDPTNGPPEEAKTIEALSLFNVINNNPVIITTLPYDQFVAPQDRAEEWI